MSDLGRKLRYLRLAVDRRRAAPVYLVLFVNGTCHARCVHCFLGSLAEGHTARALGLGVDEIARLSEHLGPDVYSILLAGGEPFMRKDIGDVLEVLSRNRELRAIKVVSNGYFTDRLVATWERILALGTDKYYGVTLSFDALAELHDQIRGVPGIFDRAVESFERLRELARRHPRFEVDTSVTISHFNQEHLGPLYEFLRDDLEVGNIQCTVTRGAPNDPQAGDVELDAYLRFTDRLAEDLLGGGLRGHTRFGDSDTLNAVNVLQRERIAEMLQAGEFISPCHAGRLSAVIGSDGKVYACELLDDCLGDLRQHDFDLMAIWGSEAARALRQKIRCTDCFCTYENANLLNVLFSPRYYPEIAVKALRMKMGRLLEGWRESGADGAGSEERLQAGAK